MEADGVGVDVTYITAHPELVGGMWFADQNEAVPPVALRRLDYVVIQPLVNLSPDYFLLLHRLPVGFNLLRLGTFD